MEDSLGNRVKENYENRTRYYLPRRTYTCARVDGKAFHAFTKDCQRPFDDGLIKSMNGAALAVCEEAQGCQFAYIQSDEASFLLTDFGSVNTSAYFDGNLQKLSSVIASTFTAWFNRYYSARSVVLPTAVFDCRVFSIPDPIEVENYFYWRWSDWRRNFAQSVGQAHFSHKELHGLNRQAIHDKLFNEKNIDLSKFPEDQKYGRLCIKKTICVGVDKTPVQSYWETIPAVNFKEDRSLLQKLVPRHGY